METRSFLPAYVTWALPACRLKTEVGNGASTNVPHRGALRAYFVLNALSLYFAAADLLLVLIFLVPGKVQQHRGSNQESPSGGTLCMNLWEDGTGRSYRQACMCERPLRGISPHYAHDHRPLAANVHATFASK